VTRRKKLLIPLAVVGPIVLALAWAWWYMAVGRFPLVGALRHDFGDLVLQEGRVTGVHTFRLVNKTGETVVIDAIRASCGCAAGEASTTEVAPGASVEVETRLALFKPGRKQARVTLMLSGFGPQTLFIEGNAVGAGAGRFDRVRKERGGAISPEPGATETPDRSAPGDR
jgi:hypothetical protein